MGAICDLWCEGCDMLNSYGPAYCDYLTIMGRRRPCPAGNGCTERRLHPGKIRPDSRLREQETKKREAEAREAAREKAMEAEARRQALEDDRQNRIAERTAALRGEMQKQRLILLDWRQRKDLTQRGAAKLCGISAKSYRDWEWGRTRAKWEKLEKAGCLRN